MTEPRPMFSDQDAIALSSDVYFTLHPELADYLASFSVELDPVLIFDSAKDFLQGYANYDQAADVSTTFFIIEASLSDYCCGRGSLIKPPFPRSVSAILKNSLDSVLLPQKAGLVAAQCADLSGTVMATTSSIAGGALFQLLPKTQWQKPRRLRVFDQYARNFFTIW
ncbi:hypothetical protein GIV76_16025, partial [Pseudomonas syringae]|uniref:hypothetical protein n=3 Tax=Pseudomonas syringae TaxID=317 RepID=UPI001F3F4E44